MELSAWFGNLLFGGADENRPAKAALAVVTVIGSGGKTSLIWRLASNMAQEPYAETRQGLGSPPVRKILVTPTTKMLVPPPEEKFYDRYCDGIPDGLPPAPVPGITLAGLFNKTTGKLESLPLQALSELVPSYDLVLIEGDGARGLPLKAWADYEPVIPSFTTLTVGVLPLWPLGGPISENLVHRLPLFLALTGAAAGETLKPEHICALITSVAGRDDATGGLFAKARGKKLLFFNQVEDDEALRRAREIAGLLPPDFLGGLSGVIAGSVRLNRVFQLL